MGVVWLAEDQVIGRRVALKELRTTEVERVLSEARTAGRLNSPNVVAIHDVITDDGVTYIVMELVEAPTLSDLMARQTFDEDQVADIALQTLSASPPPRSAPALARRPSARYGRLARREPGDRHPPAVRVQDQRQRPHELGQHFDTLQADCEGNGQRDGQLGWVLTGP